MAVCLDENAFDRFSFYDERIARYGEAAATSAATSELTKEPLAG
jgi:hypothetical protein